MVAPLSVVSLLHCLSMASVKAIPLPSRREWPSGSRTLLALATAGLLCWSPASPGQVPPVHQSARMEREAPPGFMEIDWAPPPGVTPVVTTAP